MACKCKKKWDRASTYTSVSVIFVTIAIFVLVYLILLKKKLIVGGVSVAGIGIALAGLGYMWQFRDYGTLQNCTDVIVLAKPENGTDPIVVQKGEMVKNIDGVWAPWFPERVLKIPNGVYVCFDLYGNTEYPNVISKGTSKALRGGWYHESKLAEELGQNWVEFYTKAINLYNSINQAT